MAWPLCEPAPTSGCPALGTSPPSPTLNNYSIDSGGTINLGTGTSPAAGAMFGVLLGANVSGYTTATGAVGIAVPVVTITPLNAASAGLGAYYVTWSANYQIFYVTFANLPAASQAINTYQFAWTLTGFGV